MIYSPLVKKACCILFEAHKCDVDKGGYPYVFHPFYLATQMDDEISTCVALLHDVIEDHGDIYSFDSLLKSGMPETVIEALALLTHPSGMPYPEYINRISENETASKVKMADLIHNMDTARIDGQRSPKYDLYVQALDYLESIW